MGYGTILVDRTDGVATITLNRPQARNALDLVMRRELLSALDELEAETAIRIVILTGGGGHFSAGGDVKTMAAKRQTAAEGRARVESLNRFIIRLFEYPKPTIAMVDGFAVGAGCNIALGCDIVIASDRARFGEVFAKIGLVPAAAGPGSCPGWSAWPRPRSWCSRPTSSTRRRRCGSASSTASCPRPSSRRRRGPSPLVSRRARRARSASPRRC